jgi:hypothetical protein
MKIRNGPRSKTDGIRALQAPCSGHLGSGDLREGTDENRIQADADLGTRARNPMSDADATNRAVARVISLLNEIVEKGALPAL